MPREVYSNPSFDVPRTVLGPAGRVIVLGANGRLGSACVRAFQEAGWQVTALSRTASRMPVHPDVISVYGDATDEQFLTSHAQGQQVIVNAVNASYGRWATVTPLSTKAVCAAAANTNATVIIPGNIYHFGATAPEDLDESTPPKPSTDLGNIRLAMEREYAFCALDNSFQVLVLRAGDFLDGRKSGGWFDSQIAVHLHDGKVTYPGPLEVHHQWAYLPDFARGIVSMANKRRSLPSFFAIGFPGHVFSGQQLVDLLSDIVRRPLKVSRVPWTMLRLLGAFNADLRGVNQMAYLWHRPHRVDGRAFSVHFPEFRHTPLKEALTAAVSQLREPKVEYG